MASTLDETNSDWTDLAPAVPTTPATPPVSQENLATLATVATESYQGAEDDLKQLTAMEYLAQHLTTDEVEVVIAQLGDHNTTMEDLKLVDAAMAKEAVSGLKLIPRKKALDALLKVSTPAVVPATSESKATAAPSTSSCSSPVEECVAICIDHSYSMGATFDEQKAWNDDGNANALNKTLDKRTRMDAVKAVFYAFRDRTETLGVGKHEIGLIQYDDKIEKMLGLTSSLNLFEEIVDDIEKKGSTAIYSAILEGVYMLRPMFEKSPSTDLRILLLTDGQNNAGVDPTTALQEVNKIGAIVDAIIVGDSPDDNLRRIVTATGGSCFQIKSLSEGFELMESEPVVSLRARRGGVDKPPFVQREMPASGFSGIKAKALTSGRSAATVMTHTAVTAKKVVKLGAAVSVAAVGSGNRRIMKEFVDMQKEDALIFPDEANFHLMKALVTGPTGTPFEGGTFVLNIRLPNDYPFKPPKITFETPIYHCNVTDTGAICLDILRDSWSASLTVSKAVTAIRSLLSDPDTENAMRQWIAELTLMHRQSGGKDTRYMDAATAATKANASRSVEGWKAEWGLSS